MGCNLQESLENIINTMGTLLGVHPIVPWYMETSPEQKYPLVNDHIAGWNDIPIFNRKYIFIEKVPHFPASYVRLPTRV